jgi:hypothetical protein
MASVIGVEPGDRIVLGSRGASPRTVNLSATSSLASGVDHYKVSAGCGGVSSPRTGAFQIQTDDSCRRSNAWTAAAIAFSNATDASQFSVVTGATEGTPFQFANWRPAFEMSSFTVGFSAPPAGTTRVDVIFDYPYPTVGSTYQAFTTTSGDAQFVFPPDLVPMLTYSVGAVVMTGTGGLQSGTTYRRTVAPLRMETVNLRLLALPLVEAVTGDFTDTARPTLTWSAAGEGVDMVHLLADWDGIGFYEWHVYGPPDMTSFRVPAIPLDHVELIPPAGMGWMFSAVVNHVDLQTGGWAEARQDPAAAPEARSAYRTFNLDLKDF